MARQRPIAGQRGRPRSEQAPVEPPAPVAPRAEPPVPAPHTAPPAPPASPAAARGRRPGRVDALLLGALALVLVLGVTAGLLVLKARAGERAEQARSQALAAAERHAVTLLSYDHRHLDRDFAAGRKVLTGGFAADYARTTEKVVRPTALEVKAVVTAEAAASSVVRAGENRAVVLLFVDQTTTSTRLDGPRVDLNRVRLTLDRSGGQWLVSGVDAL